jgi:hypothetical protein
MSIARQLPRLSAEPGAPCDVRVLVVQETRLNLLDARRYGELVFLLPEQENLILNAQPVARRLRRALLELNVNPRDYLLLTGDPAAIALTAVLVAELCGGRLNLLKYDRQERRYFPVLVDPLDRQPARVSAAG